MGLFERLFGKKDKVKESDRIDQQTSEAVESIQEAFSDDLSKEKHQSSEKDFVEQVASALDDTETQSEKALESEQQKEPAEESLGSYVKEFESATEAATLSHSEQSPQPMASANSLSSSALSESPSHEGDSSFEPQNSPRFESLMADYYAKKAAVAAAAERGESIELESVLTRQARELSTENNPFDTLENGETTEEKYSRSLKKTRTGFAARLNEFFANFRTVDEAFFEELEELLILSDVGVTVATQLTEDLRQEARLEKAKKPEDLRQVVIEKLVAIYEKDDRYHEAINFQDGLTVMLFVGVNGVGKTTSVGKLAYQYKQEGKKVMLVAADTFRAGAVAQLVEWGRRVSVPVVTGPEKADPASVVFDGVERAVSEGIDVLMIDTAGRLQNKDNLMKELEKIGRIIKRVVPEAPHETLLALDASTGQNALSQAKEFSKITPLTGLVLTKIDGTAKGGVVLAIRQELDIPVKLIGFGEKIDDIGPFNSEDFMRGLLEGLI